MAYKDKPKKEKKKVRKTKSDAGKHPQEGFLRNLK